MRFIGFILVIFFFNTSIFSQTKIANEKTASYLGATIRGDAKQQRMALVFTGDEYFEGLKTIIATLADVNIKGSFFFTGRLYRNKEVRDAIMQLKSTGHYLGPHSDMHLLYNDWTNRNHLLLTKDSLVNDLKQNYRSMEALGIDEQQLYLIPPFEWWNDSVATWCKQLNVQLINFTPGTGTNADYTYPEMGSSYRSSEKLLERLYAFEKEHSLNGAMVLVHIGTDPRRKDKFYDQLPAMIQYFRLKGYDFVRVDELIGQ